MRFLFNYLNKIYYYYWRIGLWFHYPRFHFRFSWVRTRTRRVVRFTFSRLAGKGQHCSVIQLPANTAIPHVTSTVTCSYTRNAGKLVKEHREAIKSHRGRAIDIANDDGSAASAILQSYTLPAGSGRSAKHRPLFEGQQSCRNDQRNRIIFSSWTAFGHKKRFIFSRLWGKKYLLIVASLLSIGLNFILQVYYLIYLNIQINE